jgi:hypothetical protein
MFFSLGAIDWSICLIVLSLSIFLGLYLAIRKKSSADSASFFLADRSLSWPGGDRIMELKHLPLHDYSCRTPRGILSPQKR